MGGGGRGIHHSRGADGPASIARHLAETRVADRAIADAIIRVFRIAWSKKAIATIGAKPTDDVMTSIRKSQISVAE